MIQIVGRVRKILPRMEPPFADRIRAGDLYRLWFGPASHGAGERRVQ